MKKKMWFVLCIMTSVLLTTACGEKKEPGEEKKETAVQTETAMQTETVVQTETESDQDFQGRESLKLGLFTVYYPEEWKYDKECRKMTITLTSDFLTEKQQMIPGTAFI